MLWSTRSIAVVAAAVLAFTDPSEGFVSTATNHASRLETQRIMHPINIPVSYKSIVFHASTVADEEVDEKELVVKLRSSTVTNVNDELVSLGDIMGSEKSVVVFLRHLG